MAHYSQWAKARKTPRVAWVCGPEAVLRCDVVDAYRLAYPSIMHRSVYPGEQGAWDTLLTLPQQPRLHVVWGAEKLDHQHRVADLLDDEFEGAFTVFVSAEGDFPRDRPFWFTALRDSRHGMLVRCCTPRDTEAQAALVASWWPGAGRNIAAALLERCGGDITEARHATRKAIGAGLLPSLPSVYLACLPENHTSFADFLVAGAIRPAMDAAAVVLPDDAGMVLGLVSSRLGVLALLGDAARKGENVAEVARRQKIDPYLVRLLRQHCAAYTPQKAAHCRQLLAMAEHAWRSGARDGILEAVVALW